LEPADADEVIDPAPEAVPEPVFRGAGHPGSMMDSELSDGLASAMHEDGQEPVPTVERQDSVEGAPPEHAKEAARILKINA
jgi:hypothetical protein